ncbi:MAG: hypothetical protein KJ709_03350 [Nanoarchaeota archaeon]|nr:hypothetical protein [Nanoarchaeota archaeon]
MINKKEFDSILNGMDRYDKLRESLIRKSREVLKESKQLIYALHRDQKAASTKAEKAKRELDVITRKHDNLRHEGMHSAAMQEYVEAMTYKAFLHGKALPSRTGLGVNSSDYLMGLCDLTGELARRAVRLATARKKAEVERILSFLQALEGQFIRFDFANGQLRKKYDSIKWNLKKVEEVLYDLR